MLPVRAIFVPLCNTVPGRRAADSIPLLIFAALVVSVTAEALKPRFVRAVDADDKSARLLLGCSAAEYCATGPSPRLVRAVAAFVRSDRLFDDCRNTLVDCVAADPNPRLVRAALALLTSLKLFAASKPLLDDPACSVHVFAAVQR